MHHFWCRLFRWFKLRNKQSLCEQSKKSERTMELELEELSHDGILIARMKQFRDATLRIESTIKLITNPPVYEKLSKTDQIKHDLLLSYTFNSLFWMYLRAEGVDPVRHKIKGENDRLKRCMARAKQINDRNTLMPRINKKVGQRFIRNSLWQAKNEKTENKKPD